MAIQKLFKSRQPFIQMAFPDGETAKFIAGRFSTGNPTYIDFLDGEINRGNKHIYVDPTETEIDTNALSPAQQMEAKIRKQMLEELRASGQLVAEVETGDSAPEKLSPANTATINSNVAGGTTAGITAKLQAMKTGAGTPSNPLTALGQLNKDSEAPPAQ